MSINWVLLYDCDYEELIITHLTKIAMRWLILQGCVLNYFLRGSDARYGCDRFCSEEANIWSP